MTPDEMLKRASVRLMVIDYAEACRATDRTWPQVLSWRLPLYPKEPMFASADEAPGYLRLRMNALHNN